MSTHRGCPHQHNRVRGRDKVRKLLKAAADVHRALTRAEPKAYENNGEQKLVVASLQDEWEDVVFALCLMLEIPPPEDVVRQTPCLSSSVCE